MAAKRAKSLYLAPLKLTILIIPVLMVATYVLTSDWKEFRSFQNSFNTFGFAILFLGVEIALMILYFFVAKQFKFAMTLYLIMIAIVCITFLYINIGYINPHNTKVDFSSIANFTKSNLYRYVMIGISATVLMTWTFMTYRFWNRQSIDETP